MGKLEQEVKRARRNRNIQKTILGVIGVAGVLSVMAVAPNVIGALAMLSGGQRYKKDPKYYVKTSLGRLKTHGLIYWQETDRGTFVRLTPKGERKLREWRNYSFVLKKPRRWDKKWRIVIFDIKEFRKSFRDKLRRTLINMGFVYLQDSVWVYPYDCEDFINLLKADFHIGRDILYIVAEKIEGDRRLKEIFELD